MPLIRKIIILSLIIQSIGNSKISNQKDHTIQQFMRLSRKVQSPYFRKRDSFQSPQCSTVFQINPTCESDQSMLQRIIFSNQNNFQNEKYQPKRRQILKQRNPNIFNKNTVADQKFQRNQMNKNMCQLQPKLIQYEERYIKQTNQRSHNFQSKENNNRTKDTNDQRDKYSPRKRLNSSSLTKNLLNYNSISRQKDLSADFKMQNYQSVQLGDYSKQKQGRLVVGDENNFQRIIDEKRLRQIQQKIKNHQDKNRQNNHNQVKNKDLAYRKMSLRQNVQNQLNNYSTQQSLPNNLSKRTKVVNNISFEKGNLNRFQSSQDEKVTLRQTYSKAKRDQNCVSRRQPFLNTNFKQIKRILQQIYQTVLDNQKQALSLENMNLKKLSVEQIKLVLGPIFAQVRIKNKRFSQDQFLQMALQIINYYEQGEIQGIIRLFRTQTDRSQQTIKTKNIQGLIRMPGKLLSNSKAGIRKQKQDLESKLSNIQQKGTLKSSIQSSLQNKQHYSTELHQTFRRKNYQENTEKVTKNAYMRPTQGDQTSPSRISKNTNKYSTQFTSNEKAFEMMLAEQKLKGYVSPSQVPQQRNVYSQDDQELQRLKNLQQRFNQHFGHKK